MGDVQGSIAVEKTQKNLHKPSGLTANMIVAYTRWDLVYIRKLK